MDERKHDVDERRSDEDRVEEPEGGAQPPARLLDRDEDRVVDEREDDADYEVEAVPERLGADAVVDKGRPEEEWQVHASEVELVRSAQGRGEHQSAHDPAGKGSPDVHVPVSSSAAALLIRARWVSAWGVLPRNSPVAGS